MKSTLKLSTAAQGRIIFYPTLLWIALLCSLPYADALLGLPLGIQALLAGLSLSFMISLPLPVLWLAIGFLRECRPYKSNRVGTILLCILVTGMLLLFLLLFVPAMLGTVS